MIRIFASSNDAVGMAPRDESFTGDTVKQLLMIVAVVTVMCSWTVRAQEENASKKDLEEVREALQGVAESASEYRGYVDALRKIKISGYVQAQWRYTDITTPSSNKKLVLSAEYAGAVIVPGSGTNHIGDMIGGNTGNNSPRYMNYYEWKGRSSSGIQTYQIILRITLPNDFTEWLNNAIVIDYLVNSGCNLQLSFYNLSNTLLTSQTLYSSGWNTTTIWASSLSSWITPGETVALIITLSSTNNNVVRIGDIILNYK